MTIGIDLNDVIRDFTGQFITIYEKFMEDPQVKFDKDEDLWEKKKLITDFDFAKSFKFVDKNGNIDHDAYNRFTYEDFAFELFARASTVTAGLAPKLNMWMNNALRDMEHVEPPTVIFFAPKEIGIAIPSTFAFLARIGVQVRQLEFPEDSHKMWDKCDIIVSANPDLLKAKPKEGDMKSVKINTSYNTEVEADYTFDTMEHLIDDEERQILKWIEKH